MRVTPKDLALKDRAPTLTPPSPRLSRGEGKGEGEGQRKRSKTCLSIAFGGNKSKIVRFDMAFESSFDRRQDCFKHFFPVLQHVDVPKAQHGPAIRDDKAIPDSIMLAADMLTPVNLDNKLAVPAGEFGKVG
jgi:hypothetical protein